MFFHETKLSNNYEKIVIVKQAPNKTFLDIGECVAELNMALWVAEFSWSCAARKEPLLGNHAGVRANIII